MRTKLVIAFVMFTIGAVLLLWIFNSFFLDNIHQFIKTRDLNRCSDYVNEVLEDEDMNESLLKQAVKAAARKYGVCISAYRIDSSSGTKTGELILDEHTNPFCYIHNFKSNTFLNKIYVSTAEKGGEFSEQIMVSSAFGTQTNSEEGKNLLNSKIVSFGDIEYLMLYNIEVMPISTTVSTIQAELAIISIILLVTAVIVATILSSKLSKPISSMSKEASKLALGNYDVKFEGGSYAETVVLSDILNQAATEMSQSDRMQKDLIANVSHDLRTPLTLIKGYAEMMRDIPGEATPENMQTVIDETDRLSALVNDMIEVNRAQEQGYTLNMAPFNLTEVIKSSVSRFSKMIETSGITINIETPGDIMVSADESRIIQVMYNLIGNAVNHVGDDKTVTVRESLVGGNDCEKVLIEVIDNGAGIPEEELPLIWDRYYKSKEFHNRNASGSGLGLSIVKNILAAHNAEFGVKSAPGKGSNFWFKLNTI